MGHYVTGLFFLVTAAIFTVILLQNKRRSLQFIKCSDLYSPKIVIYTIESVGATDGRAIQTASGQGWGRVDQTGLAIGRGDITRVTGSQVRSFILEKIIVMETRDSHAAAGNIKSQESCVRPQINSNVYKIMPGGKS